MSVPERGFFFRGKEYPTPEELAAAFLEGDEAWNDAMFVVGRGFVQKWLEYNGDFGRAAAMEKNAEKSAEERCALFASEFAIPVTPEAQYRLGKLFLEGVVAPRDSVKAAEWLSLAAEQGHPYAQSCLDAAALNRPAAERGDPLSHINPEETENAAPEPGDAGSFGCCFDPPGQSDAPDQAPPEATAMDGSHPDAGAVESSPGPTVCEIDAETPDAGPGDAASPVSHREDAEEGNADAQFNLGRMYANGLGVPQDDSLAIEWYRKAVKQGQPDALYNLGRMYENGRAVRQNFVKAYRLYFRASLHGIREADDAMLELRKKSWLRRPKVSEAEAARIEQEEGYRPGED